MPRCLPPVRICTETRLDWCLCCALHSGMLTWPQDAVWWRCGYGSTQNQSVRERWPLTAVTLWWDRTHPLVQGMLWRDDQRSKSGVFVRPKICVELCVYMHSRSRLGGACTWKMWGHAPNMFAYENAVVRIQLCLHVCLYVCKVCCRKR